MGLPAGNAAVVKDDRPGAVFGHVDPRRVDPPRRRTGAGDGPVQHLKSQVSKLCKDIDERVNAFLDRPLDGECPYLWLDATTSRSGTAGRIVSVAAIIAVAASAEGRREIIGLGIGPSEAEPFWSGSLKNLVKRGL